MSDISICFSRKDFEYDVYTLVKAFYPSAEIHTFYEGDGGHPQKCPIKLDVVMHRDGFVFKYSSDGTTKEASQRFGEGADRLERKNILKRLIYGVLSGETGRKLPWGALTGIRPTKIPMKLMEEGMGEGNIVRNMKNTYLVSDEKASLALEIAKRERKLIKSTDAKNGYSLYISIPFCPSICLYCSFGSHPYDRWRYLAEAYLEALFKELDYIASAMKDKKPCTIYIGGGTPTTLGASQLESLLEHLGRSFDISGVSEFTVEAGRPDTIDKEKLGVLKKYSVSRISINPQTMNDKTLEVIGRKHTARDVENAFSLAREVGFENINMDIIAGLPHEGEKEINATVLAIEKLKPDSLTVHSLALKRSTRLNLYKDIYAKDAFVNSQKIMDIVANGAKRMNMEPYYLYRQKNMAGNLENIGYARRGCFGLYNVLIMEEVQTIIAAGSGAISKFIFENGRIERCENVKDLNNYIGRIDEMLDRKEKYLKCS